MKVLIAIIIVAILGLFVFMSSCERIDAGHEGIKVNQFGSDKGVDNVALVTGMVFYNPFTERIFEFPIFIQTVDYEAFTVNAKDGSSFTVDPTLTFQIKAGSTPKIFRKYRKSLEEITMMTLYNYTKDAFRLQMNKYTTEEIISNRLQFETDVQNTLTAIFKEDGFLLEQLTSGLVYPQTIVDAVNAKNKAVQDAQEAENQIRTAEARAKKRMIEAETEAKANALISQSLTENIIRQNFINRWDGKAPLYSNSPTFFKDIK